jgi:hypothetical protein
MNLQRVLIVAELGVCIATRPESYWLHHQNGRAIIVRVSGASIAGLRAGPG